ncbi:MAG: GNA1162 family protein [Candidatus Limimorpha sp.]
MRKIFNVFLCVALAAVLLSCATNSLSKGEQYSKLYEEKPLVLLVMPPINNTAKVEAKELLYTSICQPLSEAGYYVIPPFAAMEVFKNESAYDAEMFLDSPLGAFKDYFGADAVVFSQIDVWEKILAGIKIKVTYIVKSTKTNDILFERSCDLTVDMTVNSSTSILGMVMELAAASIEAALTDEIVAARIANEEVFRDLPYGKYHPRYLKDVNEKARNKEIVSYIDR